MNSFNRKKSIFFLTAIIAWETICFSNSLFAAENAIPYQSISYNFYDIEFINSQLGWMCGKSGLFYRTQDGGLTWERLNIGSDNSVFGITFTDENHGFIAGQNALLMETQDGGSTWQNLASPVDKTFLALDFFNDQFGMAVGDWGKIIATSDGGKTWTELSLEEDILLYDLKFISPDEIWIAAEMGALFHSTDGGKTWEKNQLTAGSLFAIDFDKQGNGIAVGVEGTVLRSSDGGATWEESQITRESLYNVLFSNDHAIVVGDAGTIMMNYKNDQSWRPLDVPSYMKANWIQCLEILDPGKFIVAGARGSISFIEGDTLVRP